MINCPDSIDKIVESYFHGVSKERFIYKGKIYHPKPLYVAPHFFHEFTCKMNCAGCCSSRFTLDYLPQDKKPLDRYYIEREFVITTTPVKIFTRDNKANKTQRFCDNVDLINGGCMIHGSHPFSCDFETMRFCHFKDHTWLGTRPYGRGWNMIKVDGERGAICDFPKTSNQESLKNAIRKMQRLKEWTDAAHLHTWIPDIIKWAEQGIQTKPLILGLIK